MPERECLSDVHHHCTSGLPSHQSRDASIPEWKYLHTNTWVGTPYNHCIQVGIPTHQSGSTSTWHHTSGNASIWHQHTSASTSTWHHHTRVGVLPSGTLPLHQCTSTWHQHTRVGIPPHDTSGNIGTPVTLSGRAAPMPLTDSAYQDSSTPTQEYLVNSFKSWWLVNRGVSLNRSYC